jgi:hypothetical protein
LNWEAIGATGAIGELVGASAVLVTLIILVVQVRHNTRATEESNRLEHATGLERQAVLSVAVQLNESDCMLEEWKRARNWHELEFPDFVRLVEAEIEKLRAETTPRFLAAGALEGRSAGASDSAADA